MSWLDRIVRTRIEKDLPRIIEEEIPRIINQALEKRLPGFIEELLAKKFKERPNMQLTEVGFNWALALALRSYWPEVSNQEAVRWLREYIDEPHGHPDHDWSPSAAETIAREYVSEVGEIA